MSNYEPTFDWYTVVSGSTTFAQGDLLNNFPIIVPPISLTEARDKAVGHESRQQATLNLFNVIVMTQSCDFIKLGDKDQVILCPRWDYSKLADKEPKFKGKGGWKNLINGRFIGAHIINKCDIENYEFDYQVIDLQRIFSSPLSVVKQVAIDQGSRVRLLPPYREHLAQAFARQFMRVGLPMDLPRDFPYHK